MNDASYISRELCITWVEYDGAPGLYFGKHPWRVIRSFPVAASFAEGAAGMIVQLLRYCIEARLPPAADLGSWDKIAFEWVGGALAEASDDRGAILLFMPPALDRLAKAAGMPAKDFASVLVDDLAEVLQTLGEKLFGDAFTFASRAP